MSNTQNNGAQPYRIDVHHHLIPQKYVELLATIGVKGTPGRDFPKWSPKKTLSLMNRNDIDTTILSMSTPGTYFKDDAFSCDLTRVINEYCANLIADHAGRFGAFAALPLPDVRGSLIELEYAMDTLALDGVCLLSNVNGIYPGAPSYNELFAELDLRKAVVFIHPNSPPNQSNRYPVFTPLLEWPLETTRAVTRLLTSGTLERYPNIRYILAHGGGSVPFLAERIASGAAIGSSYDRSLAAPVDSTHGLEILRGLYYDTAQPGDAHLATVQELVNHDHILFGTDAGWSTAVEVGLTVKSLTNYDGFDEAQLQSVGRDNALALFPRFAKKEA